MLKKYRCNRAIYRFINVPPKFGPTVLSCLEDPIKASLIKSTFPEMVFTKFKPPIILAVDAFSRLRNKLNEHH